MVSHALEVGICRHRSEYSYVTMLSKAYCKICNAALLYGIRCGLHLWSKVGKLTRFWFVLD